MAFFFINKVKRIKISHMESKTKVLINGGYPLHSFQDVEDLYMLYITSKEDRENIKRAYEFIIKKHEGQLRNLQISSKMRYDFHVNGK